MVARSCNLLCLLKAVTPTLVRYYTLPSAVSIPQPVVGVNFKNSCHCLAISSRFI